MPLNRPSREELLEAVLDSLDRELLPGATPAQGFQLRIIRRVVHIVLRELQHGEDFTNHEAAALTTLLGQGDAAQLNALLCKRIADGDMAVDDPELLCALQELADRKLALDSPGYAGNTGEDQA